MNARIVLLIAINGTSFFAAINDIKRNLTSNNNLTHKYMQQINSVNDGGNTPLMVLLLPPASVDYDNAASANTIDTPAYSAVQTATTTTEPVAVPTADTTIDASLAEKSFDQDQLNKAQKLLPYSILNHLNKNNRTALQLLKDLMKSHPSEWDALEKILKPDDINKYVL